MKGNSPNYAQQRRMSPLYICATLLCLISSVMLGLPGAGGGGGAGGGISISPPPTPQEVLPPKPIIVAPIFVKQKHHKRKLSVYHTGFPGMGSGGMFPPQVSYHLRLSVWVRWSSQDILVAEDLDLYMHYFYQVFLFTILYFQFLDLLCAIRV